MQPRQAGLPAAGDLASATNRPPTSAGQNQGPVVFGVFVSVRQAGTIDDHVVVKHAGSVVLDAPQTIQIIGHVFAVSADDAMVFGNLRRWPLQTGLQFRLCAGPP